MQNNNFENIDFYGFEVSYTINPSRVKSFILYFWYK